MISANRIDTGTLFHKLLIKFLLNFCVFIIVTLVILAVGNLDTKIFAADCTATLTPGGPAGNTCPIATNNCPAGKYPWGILVSNPLSCECWCLTGSGPTISVTPTPIATPVPTVVPTAAPTSVPSPSVGTTTPRAVGPCTIQDIDLFSDEDCSIKTWAGSLLKYLIGLGFVYAVVMTPYILYLFSKGGPSDIKRAWDLIRSILYGLLLLIFVVTVVMLIGGNILQI